MSVKSCPICQNTVNVDSRCFDCKQPIQWICYKCQWESNIRNHESCHKNILIQQGKPIQKPKVDGYHNLMEKSYEAYGWALRNTAQALA